jgi:ubiquitin C-terminal hydrolase
LSQYLDKTAERAGMEAQYCLSGVISHTGHMHAGHYVSYVKHHAYDNEWVRISDDKVSWSSFGEAVGDPEALERYSNSFFPYILAYRKVHDDVGDGIAVAVIDGDGSKEL